MTTLLDVSNNGRTATSWWWWPSCEPQMSTTVLLFLWYKINYLLCKLKAKNNKKSFSINYLTCRERRKIHQTIQFSEKWITWVTDGQEEDAGCSWGIQEDGCGQWNLKRLLELVKGVAVWVSFLFLHIWNHSIALIYYYLNLSLLMLKKYYLKNWTRLDKVLKT